MTKELLHNLYIEKDMTILEIAKKLRVGTLKVKNSLREFEIPVKRKFEILFGKKFNMLTPVVYWGDIHKKDRNAMWTCQCDCGNTTVVRASQLKNGEVKACGCLQKTGYKELSGSYLYSLKSSARKRKIDFNMTPEQLYEIMVQQKNLCAISGEEISFTSNGKNQSASLDRINSEEGYVDGNVQWVHKDVNRMKMDMTEGEFFSWCRRVVKHQDSKPSF